MTQRNCPARRLLLPVVSGACAALFLLAAATPSREQVAQAGLVQFTAVVPPDSPPTYYRDQQTGAAVGFAVDVMNAVAQRAGLTVGYTFEESWADIIEMMKRGQADLAPGMGVSPDREEVLDFSAPIDTFPISFFVRAGHPGIDASPGVHAVGGIRGSVALEKLKGRANLRLVPYEGFPEGLFDLLAGKVEAFACPAPTLWQLARQSDVDDRIKVVDRPIAEITRAIAVRKGNRALLDRLDAAIKDFTGSAAYRELYVKWYGRPVPFWTKARILLAGSAAFLAIVAPMGAWRHASVLRLNRELRETIARRREAEAALERSAAEQDTFFDVSVDLLCIADTEARFHRLNRAWERTLGFSLEELQAGKFLDFVHADDLSRTLDAVATLAAQREVVDFVNRYRCRDGGYRWIEWRAVPRGHLIYAAGRDITAQKQAAEALRLNQERLESLVRIAQSGSRSTQELLDQALEEAIRVTRSGIGYVYLYSEDDQLFTLNSWSRDVMKECSVAEPQTVYRLGRTGIWGEAVRQRRPIVVQDFHAPHPLKKGYPPGHVPLRSFLTVPVFQKERIVAVVGVANKRTPYDQDDISQLTLLMDAVWRMLELKKVEAALRENEATLRSLLNAITESALLIERDGRILAANETVARRLGAGVAEIVGRSFYELLPQEVGERRMARLNEVFAEGRPVRYEDERQGRVIDNSAYPVFGDRGEVVAAALIGVDITDRSRAAAALEASERKYRMLYDSAIDAIFIVGMDGKFIDVNRTSHERLGYTREELLALHLSQLDSPEFSGQVGARIAELLQQGQLSFESAHRRKDGSTMPVEINARVIDYDGRRAIFSIVRDITERKQAEGEREKLIAELQKALAEIKTLRGILPICSSCKKIRDDGGAWHQLEAYIRDRTDAEFSHGLCLECARKLYPDVMKKLG